MKKALIFSLFVLIYAILPVEAQDSRSLRAARMSFNSAENNYKRGNYQQAAREYQIVVNTIRASGASRRDLEARLESLIKLTDIHFYRSVNIAQACEYLNTFLADMNTIRDQGVLRPSSLLQYQRKEQEFRTQHIPKCENYRGLEDDMQEFKRRFEEEFE